MATLSLAQAEIIADETLKNSRSGAGKPLAVAVLDDGGHLRLLKREDGASMFRSEIAIGKAWGAVAMGVSSRAIAQVSQQHPQFVAALTVASGGNILPNPGGVLIKAKDGSVVGAVGVSGDSADRDESFAIAGIAAAGLLSDPATATQS